MEISQLKQNEGMTTPNEMQLLHCLRKSLSEANEIIMKQHDLIIKQRHLIHIMENQPPNIN